MIFKNHKYVLVTGANSGLGLGICTRLIDEFLATHPPSDSLTLLFTTRSPRKSSATLQTLNAHLARHKTENAQRRVHLRPESVELTNLLSVRSLARRLVASDLPCLNAIVLNAGIGGWSGLDWPMAVRTVLADIRRATTWPPFKNGVCGLTTKSQFAPTADGKRIEEPPLAEVFTANVFGHYMLAHLLMSLLWACNPDSPGKLVWVGSVEPLACHYNPADPQGFLTDAAYEHSKRIADLLSLTHTHSATQKSVNTFFAPPPHRDHETDRPQTSRPTIQVSHPGILTTTIIALYWIVQQAYLLAIYLARWVGAPWSTVSPYPAAASATFLSLVSAQDLKEKEHSDSPHGGQGKWGSSISRFGKVTVRRTDVEGWGIDGSGTPFVDSWWGGPSWWGGGNLGRAKGAKDATKEDVEDFVAAGAVAWRNMEKLRVEWEARLEEWDLLNRDGHGFNSTMANGKT